MLLASIVALYLTICALFTILRGGPGRLQLAASPQGRCFKGRGGDTLIARHAFENKRLF